MRIFKYIFYLFVYWYKLRSIQFNAEGRSLFKSKERLLISILQAPLCLFNDRFNMQTFLNIQEF